MTPTRQELFHLYMRSWAQFRKEFTKRFNLEQTAPHSYPLREKYPRTASILWSYEGKAKLKKVSYFVARQLGIWDPPNVPSAQDLEDIRDRLSTLSSQLGFGFGGDNPSLPDLVSRIEEGVEYHTDLRIKTEESLRAKLKVLQTTNEDLQTDLAYQKMDVLGLQGYINSADAHGWSRDIESAKASLNPVRVITRDSDDGSLSEAVAIYEREFEEGTLLGEGFVIDGTDSDYLDVVAWRPLADIPEGLK